MKTVSLAIVLLSAVIVHAQPASPAIPEDPSQLLGLTPGQVLERFGAPARVFSVRGAEAWQDDVVFEYQGGFAFFLCLDRVWQIRLAEPWPAPVLGFVLGNDAGRALSVFGIPAAQSGNAYEWNLPGFAWPVRLRGNGDAGGAIREIFIYRADF